MGSLTERQKSIIIGKLLGDGSLRRKANTLLEVNHSYNQKDYVLWVYEELKQFVKTPPKLRVSGQNRLAFRFTTLSCSLLNPYYESFYDRMGKKVIPTFLNLDPLILAVWLMDDGSKDRDSVYLNTQQFDLTDQQLLLNKLLNLGIKSSLNKDKKYLRIRILKESVPKFIQLVDPYILDSMRYKVLL